GAPPPTAGRPPRPRPRSRTRPGRPRPCTEAPRDGPAPDRPDRSSFAHLGGKHFGVTGAAGDSLFVGIVNIPARVRAMYFAGWVRVCVEGTFFPGRLLRPFWAGRTRLREN